MEHLQASWISEVGGVCVCGEGEIGVSSVFHGQVRGEIVEAAIMGYSYKRDALE